MGRVVNFPKREGNDMRIVTINVSQVHLDLIQKLVESRIYPSRSEAIRVAIRDWLITEAKLYKQFIDPVLDTDTIDTIKVPNGDGTYQHLLRVGEA
jgi:hypothetical protein